jgi:DNA-binding phage protein
MRRPIGTVSHHNCEVQELRADRRFAVECAKGAVESLTNAEERPGGLVMLRARAEAYGGLGAVAAKAGITRAALRRSLSPKGNPRMKVIEAVLKPLGLSLSVVPQQKKARKRAAKKPPKTACVRAAA